MALIAVLGDEATALEQRLARACPGHELTRDPASARLRIHRLGRWFPGWCAAPGDAPLLLLCPREPADPAGAFMAGIDAWLSDSCSDEELAAQVEAMLPAS